jgi:hypothetical protein
MNSQQWKGDSEKWQIILVSIESNGGLFFFTKAINLWIPRELLIGWITVNWLHFLLPVWMLEWFVWRMNAVLLWSRHWCSRSRPINQHCTLHWNTYGTRFILDELTQFLRMFSVAYTKTQWAMLTFFLSKSLVAVFIKNVTRLERACVTAIHNIFILFNGVLLYSFLSDSYRRQL